MAPAELRSLLQLTRQLSTVVRAALADVTVPGRWPELARQFSQQTDRHEPADFADAVAQAVTCGHAVLTLDGGLHLTPAARQWLVSQADPLLEQVLQLCFAGSALPAQGTAAGAAAAQIAQYLQDPAAAVLLAATGTGDAADHAVMYFFERLLSQYDARSRRRQGVYYTPPSIVGYVVRSVDELLRREFLLDDGLADGATWDDVLELSAAPHRAARPFHAAPFVRVLDPAMGTGVFLLEVFDHVRRRWTERPAVDPGPATNHSADWDEYVVGTLLPRLCGQDLMLPAVVLAQLLLTRRLSASGFRFTRPGKLHCFLGNTLHEPRIGDTWLAQNDYPYTVVLGNPPFSGVSENRDPWIGRLLRGRAPGHSAAADYFQVDGQPLGERKHWLEDDYVKFLRLAHWLIERASAGIIGFVTNHSFLDNATFRGMRQQLLRTFPRVTVVDLHGNTRTGERPPQGGNDESVFGIEQGIAISLWRRPVREPATHAIDHAGLWGQRADKLRALDGTQPVTTTPLEPHTPYYFLVPRDRRGESEYARGYLLSEIMPVNSTAAVTARDSFVVAFSAAELRDRMAALCDRDVPDDALRQRYFTSSRSTRYPPGDTRGWQLAHARERLSREPDWAHHIRDCLYRPFDRRKIFWTPWMIDWPRESVMRHLAAGNNLALVARRQIPASHRCNYVWVTDTIALDGLIRSDNRGSESVFPLFLTEDESLSPLLASGLRGDADEPAPVRQANFSADFLTHCATQLQLAWHPTGREVREDQFTALDLFHYLYALLHAASYQARFAAGLRIDFPRVFIPVRRELFRELSALGAQLVARHLLRTTRPARVAVAGAEGPVRVGSGGPRHSGERVQVNERVSIGPVPTEVWEFRVGAHQVCHKWLKDRRGRDLNSPDLTHYCQILTAVADTLAYLSQIDQAIAAHGGWPAAFA